MALSVEPPGPKLTMMRTGLLGQFLASSWAQYVGGMVAELTATETVAGQVLDPGKALATYVEVFEMIGLVGLALGAGLIVLSPILRYLAHDKDERAAKVKASR